MNDDPVRLAGRFTPTTWLAISIAANLFLVGLVVGSWISGAGRAGPPPRPPLQMMIQEASEKVSPEGLQKLSQLADDLEARFRSSMTEMAASRDAIRAQLLQEHFDAVAFGRALDELNAAFARDRSAANRRFAEVIASLSASDRKQLANIRFP
jgi:uncharacterized membrane protein